MNKDHIIKLDRTSLLEGVEYLALRDKAMHGIYERHGPPPLWSRQPGFACLLKIILEQQVSLASAQAVSTKLKSSVPEITPTSVLSLKAAGLRKMGFTRQKATYCELLAASVSSGELDLKKLARLDDEKARNRLLEMKGIGPWTADVYLLMALRRPDVWPDGDLALAESARRVKKLSERPGNETLKRMALRWKPWRSVAARMLWHAYLSEQRK